MCGMLSAFRWSLVTSYLMMGTCSVHDDKHGRLTGHAAMRSVFGR
jgi:hypothetical protein